jgi:hypothetical protein
MTRSSPSRTMTAGGRFVGIATNGGYDVRRNAAPSEGPTAASRSRSRSPNGRSSPARQISIQPQQPSRSRQATMASSPIPAQRKTASQRRERARSPPVSAFRLPTGFAVGRANPATRHHHRRTPKPVRLGPADRNYAPRPRRAESASPGRRQANTNDRNRSHGAARRLPRTGSTRGQAPID